MIGEISPEIQTTFGLYVSGQCSDCWLLTIPCVLGCISLTIRWWMWFQSAENPLTRCLYEYRFDNADFTHPVRFHANMKEAPCIQTQKQIKNCLYHVIQWWHVSAILIVRTWKRIFNVHGLKRVTQSPPSCYPSKKKMCAMQYDRQKILMVPLIVTIKPLTVLTWCCAKYNYVKCNFPCRSIQKQIAR